MTVSIKPGQARGAVTAPPSKSMSHRLLLCAGLAAGESRVHNLAFSQDILATLDCLNACGTRTVIDGSSVTLQGADPRFAAPQDTVSCRESGSTLRFFIPLFLLSGNEVTLSGEGRLPQRPQGVYEELCRSQGLLFEQNGKTIRLQGPLQSGQFSLPGDVSSQFISGLLFALPLLKEDSFLRLTGKVESRSYIDMTLQALDAFGVKACWQETDLLHIPGGQSYRPGTATVEGDWSNAAFFYAMETLGHPVSVSGLLPDSLQGDRVCLSYFRALAEGCPTLDISDCPDLGPILMAVAAAKHGVHLTGTRRLKIKESDRGQVMAQELQRFGVSCRVEENDIFVGCGLTVPEGTLCGHNDHRIVMALSVLCTLTGGSIAEAEAVSKSFPDFFLRLQELGIEVSEIETE